MKLQFKDVEMPGKPKENVWYLVECPDLNSVKYALAIFSGGEFTTEEGTDVTEHVTGYIELP